MTKENSKRKKVCLIIIFLFVCCVFSLYLISVTKEKHNVFVNGPKMHVYHNGPAVLMNDGNVLVIGGDTKKAEIYDYKKNKFIYTKGELNYKRKYGATATLLKNGNVLITGGSSFVADDKNQMQNEVLLDSAEIYNPQTQNFIEISKMCFPRTRHTAIPLESGNVLIFGGSDIYGKTILNIEEFDLKTNSFKIINKIDIDDLYFTHFVKIDVNKILLIGYKAKTHNPTYKYIYNYDTNTINPFFAISDLNSKMIQRDIYSTSMHLSAGTTYLTEKNKAIILNRNNDKILEISIVENNNRDYTSNVVNSNKILFIGGDNVQRWNGKRIISTSYFVDLNGNIFKNIDLKTPRFKHLAISLKNGDVIVLGGYGLEKGNSIKQRLDTEIYKK